MKRLEKTERILKLHDLITCYKIQGGEVTNLGRWCKWKNISNGRLQIKVDIYRCKNENGIFYVLIDTLDRVMSSFESDLNEIKNWVIEKGYKTEKEFFINDLGYSEELFEAEE